MKKLLLTLLALASVTLMSCGISSAQPGALTTFTKFENQPIKGLSIGGGWDVTIRQGNATKVTITIPENYKNYFTYNLTGGDFSIKQVKQINRVSSIFNNSNDSFRVDIVCNSLENVYLSGGADLHMQGDFNAQSFKLNVSGGADVECNGTVHCTKAEIGVSGGADVDLKVNSNTSVNIGMSGGTDGSFVINSKSTEISVSGGADGDFVINSKSTDVSVSGGADIDLHGNSDIIKYDVSGGADIDGKNFVGNDVYVTASGSADVSVHAINHLKVSKSGGAEISYKGNPRIETSNKGIRRID